MSGKQSAKDAIRCIEWEKTARRKTGFQNKAIKYAKELLDTPMISDIMKEQRKQSPNYMFTVAMSYRSIKACVLGDFIRIEMTHSNGRPSDRRLTEDKAVITCRQFDPRKKFADNKTFTFDDRGTVSWSGKPVATHPQHFENIVKSLEVLAHGARHDTVDTGTVAFPETVTHRVQHYEHNLKR